MLPYKSQTLGNYPEDSMQQGEVNLFVDSITIRQRYSALAVIRMGAEKFACIPQNNEEPSILVFLNVFRRFLPPTLPPTAALKTQPSEPQIRNQIDFCEAPTTDVFWVKQLV